MDVLVSVPNKGWIRREVCDITDKIKDDIRFKTTIIRPVAIPYENNLHQIIQKFMAGPYWFWLSIDADNPPLRNPLDCILYNKDIMGFPTPIWDRRLCKAVLTGFDYDPKQDTFFLHKPQEGLQEVQGIGTGSFLISRRVFENSEMRKAPFQREIDFDGVVIKGNDLAFSKRAMTAGFKLFNHYDYSCDHIKEISLNELGERHGQKPNQNPL